MPLRDRIFLIATAFLWGFNFVVIRWGLENVDPYLMTALRFLLVALPAVFFIRRPAVPMVQVALYGLMFGGGIWGLINIGVALGLASGLAALLLQLSAFLSVIAGLVFFRETITAKKTLGILLAFTGFGAIVLFRGEGAPLAGIILALAAAVFWTACNMLIKIARPDSVVGFVVWSSLFVPVPLFILALIAAPDSMATLTAINHKGWMSIGFQAFITTLLGYSVWTSAVARFGLADVAPFSLLVPVSGLLFGYLVYGEALSAFEAAGSALILTGLALLVLTGRKISQKGGA